MEAALSLIYWRKHYNERFENNHEHTEIWARISRRIQNDVQFTASPAQCHRKWEALKNGKSFAIQLFHNFIVIVKKDLN
jgi:hypothetical protein